MGGRAEGGGLRRPCPGVRVHVQAGMRCLRPQGLPEWAGRQVSHSCPLGSSEATPFNAFGAVPEERCKHVFTATLGLIKGFSVSCLGVNQGPPATTEGVSCKGAAGLGGASCTLVCGQGAHRGAQATATLSARLRGLAAGLPWNSHPACCLSSPASLGDPLLPRQMAAAEFAGWGSSTWPSGAQGALPAHVYQAVAFASPSYRGGNRFKVSKEFS